MTGKALALANSWAGVVRTGVLIRRKMVTTDLPSGSVEPERLRTFLTRPEWESMRAAIDNIGNEQTPNIFLELRKLGTAATALIETRDEMVKERERVRP